MGEIEDLVDRASRTAAGDDVAAMLEAFEDERRFRLQAAFAYAKRRERDPGMRRAADLLELVLATRDGSLDPPRWWQRGEVLVGGLFVVNVGNLALQASVQAGLRGVAGLLALLAVSVVVVVVWRRAVRSGRPVPATAPGMPPSSGRIAEVGERILRAGRQAVATAGVEEPRELAERLREEACRGAGDGVGRQLAAGALAYAERMLAASWEPGRRTLIEAAEQARRQVAADER